MLSAWVLIAIWNDHGSSSWGFPTAFVVPADSDASLRHAAFVVTSAHG
jgi:hypothetical protein